MKAKISILIVMALLCTNRSMCQIVINVSSNWKDRGAKNTTEEIVKKDLELTALAGADLSNASAIRLAFEERNKALVTISNDLLLQRDKVKRLIDKCATIASQQGSSYSVLSPAAQTRYLAKKLLLRRKISKLKDLVDAYFETDNYMTEANRKLLLLQVAQRALELVKIE